MSLVSRFSTLERQMLRCAQHDNSFATRRSLRRGFTLIEVLATLLLMTIALPVIMKAVSMATSAGSVAKRRVEATTLADSKINELVATGQWQNGQLSGDFGTDWPDYTWSAQVNDYDGVNKEIDVTINWPGRGGYEDALTLSTLVYPNNPITIANGTIGTSGSTSTSGTSTSTGSSLGGGLK